MRFILLPILLMLLIGCDNKVEGFDIFKPEYNLTLKRIKQSGFSWIESDEIMYSKMIGDTLLYYYFSYNSDEKSSPLYRYCQIPFKEMQKDSIDSFFYLRNSFIVSEIRKIDSCYQQFFVRNMYNNLLFECSLNCNDSTMTISYGYPLAECSE